MNEDYGFLRLPEVLEIVKVKKTTWYEGIREGRYPKQIKERGMSLWRRQDIRELCERIYEGSRESRE